MATYKLHYCKIPGFGGLVNNIMKYRGNQLEEIKYSVQQEQPGMDEITWDDAARAGMPLGQLPVLEFNGKKYCQQTSIARYLSKKFNLMGKTPEEELHVDMVQEFMRLDIASFLRPLYEMTENDGKEILKKEISQKLQFKLDKIIPNINEFILGDFTLGTNISLADFEIHDVLKMLDSHLQPNSLNIPEKLTSVKNGVEALLLSLSENH